MDVLFNSQCYKYDANNSANQSAGTVAQTSEGANMNFANKNVFFFSGKLVETS